MKAIVLAAGLGTRIRGHIGQIPKVLAPINGRPLLEHTLELLCGHGISEVHLNLHFMPEAVTNFINDGSRFRLRVIYHYEDSLLGTAGSVEQIARYFQEPFYVLYGDVFTNLNLSAMYKAHQLMKPEATIALYHVSNPTECGIVELDHSGRAAGFTEKPALGAVRSDLANAGVYVLEPSILDAISLDGPCDFGNDVFPTLISNGRSVQGYPLPEGTFLLDIGTPSNYEKANMLWREVD